MWNLLYLVGFIGVFLLQTVNAEDGERDTDMERMQQCPCKNDIIEGFLDSVSRNAVDIENGQRLRVRLWQIKAKDCSVNVVDESPNPGRIEIGMMYQGDVDILQQGEGEDQYGSDDDEGQQGSMDMGQQPGGVDFGQQQGDGSIEPQQGENVGQEPGAGDTGEWKVEDIEQLLNNIDLEELQQSILEAQMQQGADNAQDQAGADIDQEQAGADIDQEQAGADIDQEQAGADIDQEQAGADIAQEQAGVGITQEQASTDAQKQSELPNGSDSGTGGDKTVFSFMVDVNTGKLSESVKPAAQRKKRDLMPFEGVLFNIEVDFVKPDADAAARNDIIKSVIRAALGDYWLAMTNCLLGVEQ